MKKNLIAIFVLVLTIIFNCIIACKKSSQTFPTLTTTPANTITSGTSLCGGNITNDVGAAIIAKGVCWDTSINPTIALNTKTTNGTGTAGYTTLITGLRSNTTYYARAYATNSVGTAYGNQITFTTLKAPLDFILGTYAGIVHYTYHRHVGYSYTPEDSSFDTTYNFNFIVSKVFQDSFTTNTSYTTCYFRSAIGYFGYQSSNVYDVSYFPCADMYGSGWGELKFSTASDSAWYNVSSLDEEGGGRVYSLQCTETFSGKKI